MLQGEHSAILLTCIKLPFVINIFELTIFSGCFKQVLLYFNEPVGGKLVKPHRLVSLSFSDGTIKEGNN